MAPKRIQVKETEQYYGDFSGTIDSIIAGLELCKDEGWEGIEEESVDYSGAVEYYLYKYREENDKEYNKRMKEIEKRKQQELKSKEIRRKQYEKLKKEFDFETNPTTP